MSRYLAAIGLDLPSGRPRAQMIGCWHGRTIWENSVAQHLHVIMPLVAATRSVKFRRARFWCGCNPPARGRLSCLGAVPLGPIKGAVGRPRKMRKCNGAKEAIEGPPPPPPSCARLQFLGFTAYPFCGDVEQICLGEGLRPEMGSPGQAGEGRASGLEPVQDSKACPARWLEGTNISRIRTMPCPYRRTANNTGGVEIEERTTLRLMPRVSLARCLRNRDAT